jgi:hypothetical protein
MAIWIKPNGKEIETNDHKGNIEAAKALGWKKKKAPKKEVEAPQLDALQESNDD